MARLRGVPDTRTASHVAIIFASLVLAAVPLCAAGQSAGGAAASPPSVVLVTVDTLRADALGCYGGEPGATPILDRIAADGAQFLDATCPMPHTRPSHFSMLTGLYPRDHGVVNNLAVLPEKATTLAEVLHDAGYATAGFVGAVHLGPASGAGQGFDVLSAPSEPATWTSNEVVSRALEWLRGSPTRERPFLLWVHLFDPHLPYAPPAGFQPPRGPGARAFLQISWPILLDVARQHGGDVPAEVLDQARSLYQGEARFVDHEIGRLLEWFRTQDRLDRTILVVAADHGECFDHGVFFDHSDCLYDGAVRVPLLVRYPTSIPRGQRLGGQVELRRLPATILRLARIEPPSTFGHETLFEQAADPHSMAFIERAFYPASSAARRDQRLTTLRSVAGEPIRRLDPDQDWVGVRTSSWKYLRMGERRELYDLTTDPGERANLVTERAAARDRLDSAVQSWIDAHPARSSSAGEVSDEMRESLEALGYTH